VDWERHDFDDLASRHGTPFYLYDLDAAIEHARALRAALDEPVDLYYCAKANASGAVLAAFRPHVAGLDVSSAGEIELAQAAGYDPGVMSFAGPGKSERELETAVRLGVKLLSVESVTELGRVARLAAVAGRSVDVTLRINPLEAPRQFPMKMGGLPSPFGIPEEEALEVTREALATPGITVRGFHVFSGTNCLDPDALRANIDGVLAIARRLSAELDLEPSVVNLGGGFGVPYFAGQEPLDLPAVARSVNEAVTGARAADPRLARTRFILELGRFLIAPFGVYVARVLDVKRTRGKRFVILDGGMHHCFPPTGNFGQVIKKNYPVVNLSRPGAESEPQEICGPLCTPIDRLGRDLPMAPAEIGDLVGFLRCGAYSFAASPLLFLSHETPLELVLCEGRVEVARERKPATAFA
jgi:diaminopimelate decarboxylase